MYETRPTKMDGYVRVSKRMGREGPGYISPKVQREAIERWASYKGVTILEWHVDEDESGGTQNRPGLRRAMKRIEAGDTQGLACWRLNRFARNVSGAIADVERIQAAGGSLALVEEDIDPTGPFGRMILTVLLAVATLERDNISASWKTAKKRAVDRGVRMGPALIGYQRGKDGVLEPHKQDAALMKKVYKAVATNGLDAGVRMLRQAKPERTWTPAVLRRLLASRVYLGEVNYGDLTNKKAHKPLVSRGEWEAAQVPAQSNKRKSQDYPLSGVLICSGCKRPMVGSVSNGIRVYRCKYGKQGHPGEVLCEAPAVVTANRAEDYVRFAWERLMAGEGVGTRDDPVPDSEGAQEALDEAEAELEAFASDLTLRKALGGKYHELLEARVEAVNEARAALAETTKDVLQQEQVTSEEMVKDPAMLGEAARRAFRSIEVLRGRGLPIQEKLILWPYGLHERLPLTPQNF